MKIISCNVNYFLGFDGSLSTYARYATRGIRANQRAEDDALTQFRDFIQDEHPDVVCLLEVDQGSIRTRTGGHITRLNSQLKGNGASYSSAVDTKYGPSKILSQLPILRHMSNGVLWQGDASITRHYLSKGSKQLVYEIEKEGISIFSLHLPLIRHYRRKQLEELAGIVAERENAIVCGDFNNYHGRKELETFAETAGLEIHSPGETLPNAMLPYREVDLVLASPDITVERCESAAIDISDHLPVIIEVSL